MRGSSWEESWPQHKGPAHCTNASNVTAGTSQEGSHSSWPQHITNKKEYLFRVCATSSPQPVLAAQCEACKGSHRRAATPTPQQLLAT